MVSCEIELLGMDELLDTVEKLGKQGTKAMNKALEAGAEPVLSEIQSTTQFKDRTGKLRKAQKISKVRKTKKGKSIWVGDVDGEAKYGWIVEYGNSKQHARPFMREAWNRKKAEAQARIKETLAEELSKIE